MKKIAIVYYSMSENTDYVAKNIFKKMEADLIRIVPKKEYPDTGFKKFFWGGKSAVMKETPTLEKYEFDSNKYDYIVFGTPVWASSFAPPIRTFIEENKENLKDKKIAVFVCYSGMGADKAIEKLKKCLEINDFCSKLTLVDPREKELDENKEEIDEFCEEILKN